MTAGVGLLDKAHVDGTRGVIFPPNEWEIVG